MQDIYSSKSNFSDFCRVDWKVNRLKCIVMCTDKASCFLLLNLVVGSDAGAPKHMCVAMSLKALTALHLLLLLLAMVTVCKCHDGISYTSLNKTLTEMRLYM